MTGPDRASENRFARSLGYKVGRFPLVPLAGAVVAHNPGILEVYQTNTEYRVAAGAIDYMKDLAAAAVQAETGTVTEHGKPLPRPVPVRLIGAENTAYETPQTLIPDVGPTERSFTFSVRIGRYVLQMSVQGGDALDLSVALGALNTAALRLAQSCSLPPVILRAG